MFFQVQECHQESKSQTLQNPQCHCNPDQSHASNVPIVVEVHLKGLKPSEFHESPGKRGAREDDEYHETLPPKTNSWNWNPPPKLLEVFVGIVGGNLFPISSKITSPQFRKTLCWNLTLLKKAHLQDWGEVIFFLQRPVCRIQKNLHFGSF